MSIVGTILGDIAGSKWEFESEIPNWHCCELFGKDSVYTDDTIQTIAIGLASITDMNYEKWLLALGKKYYYVGFGMKFQEWLRSRSGCLNDSWGNGAAMRVSVIGMLSKSLKEAEESAEKSATCTHGSYEGIKGAQTIAGCIFLAKSHLSKQEIFKYAISKYPLSEYEYSPERPLNEYSHDYHFEASCQKSVPVAIRCFLESSDYESCIRNVFLVNGDTDTLGAMAGGIAGAYYGLEDDKYIEVLQDYLEDELFEYVLRIQEAIVKK